MNGLVRIFFTGMLISFLGCIPLGTLNIAAMQMSIAKGIQAGVVFTLGAAFVEMLYVRISLKAIDWVRNQRKWFIVLEWMALLIVLVLAVTTFFFSSRIGQQYENPLLTRTLPPIFMGLLMSAINPMQVPFWFGWSTLLFSKGTLLPRRDHYNVYTAGIGLGTISGFSLFIAGGKLLVDQLNANQQAVNNAIGSIYVITALVFIYKMIRKKNNTDVNQD